MTVHQGKRAAKVTFLLPESLNEDLRALRMVTGQSTGDLINQLIEAHVEGCREDVEAGRRMLAIREERAGRRREDPPAVAEVPIPGDADVESWTATEKMKSKARTAATLYLAWCKENGKPFMDQGSVDAYNVEVLLKENAEDTANDKRRRIQRFIAWWGEHQS